MHFIRARVIQRDDSSVMAAVYSTTTLFAASYLWTQLDPEEPHPSPPTLLPRNPPVRSKFSPSVDLTRLLSLLARESSGYTDEKHRKRGRPEVVCLRGVSGVSLLPVQCRSSSPKIRPKRPSCRDCSRYLRAFTIAGEMFLGKSEKYGASQSVRDIENVFDTV